MAPSMYDARDVSMFNLDVYIWWLIDMGSDLEQQKLDSSRHCEWLLHPLWNLSSPISYITERMSLWMISCSCQDFSGHTWAGNNKFLVPKFDDPYSIKRKPFTTVKSSNVSDGNNLWILWKSDKTWWWAQDARLVGEKLKNGWSRVEIKINQA